jgi:hypothetical protein
MDSWKLFLNGLLANMQEVEFSAMRRQDLAPVVFHLPLGFLLVMPRLQTYMEYFGKLKWGANYVPLWEDMIRLRYARDEMREFMLSDLSLANWAMLRNKPVKIDYGN